MSYMYAYTRLPRHWLLHLHACRLRVIRDPFFFFFFDIYNHVRVYIVAN